MREGVQERMERGEVLMKNLRHLTGEQAGTQPQTTLLDHGDLSLILRSFLSTSLSHGR